MVDLTVIIPTYNRSATLLRCLDALERQTLERSRYEIIVIDDGSTDDTHDQLRQALAAGRIRFFAQSNAGPAKARNVGIEHAVGEVVLFLGDDIFATTGLLEEHVTAHRDAEGPVGVMGLTEWADTIEVTPLMQLEALGQFDYHLIRSGAVDATNLPFHFFYTSNASVRRGFLEKHGLRFDEDFRHAMGEDGELAFRMTKHGLRLIFRPEALASHEHPMTFDGVCRRRRLMGQVAVMQARKHPELGDLSFLRLSWRGRLRHWAFRRVADVLMPILRSADRRRLALQGWPLARGYAFVFGVCEMEGLRDAVAAGGVPPRVVR
jgi:glycosyltransferase involved in cell wall biosynthesis